MPKRECVIAAAGDVHGHLQLACAVFARWQETLGVRFEALFLSGDVGTFTELAQLDSATRAHARQNPCELEFLYQWSASPQPPWLEYLFKPREEGGLGLCCPLVMVHGNHEGFDHLEPLVRRAERAQRLSSPPDRLASHYVSSARKAPAPFFPHEPVPIQALPPVDSAGHVRLLPSGWRLLLPSGHVVAGVGGIESGQRRAKYRPMAYIDDTAVLNLLEHDPVDVLITHQGPSGIQGAKGSDSLQVLLDAGAARLWFHGHSVAAPQPRQAGPAACLVVPLGDVAFHRPPHARWHDLACEVGRDGWAWATLAPRKVAAVKESPDFLREFRRNKWASTHGMLVCPPLARFAWQPERP